MYVLHVVNQNGDQEFFYRAVLAEAMGDAVDISRGENIKHTVVYRVAYDKYGHGYHDHVRTVRDGKVLPLTRRPPSLRM